MRGRIEISGRNVARFSGVEIGDENMMANIRAPFVPMPEWQSRQEPDLDRIFLERLARAPVAFVILALRIDVRDEGDLFPVGGHNKRRLYPSRDFRNLLDTSAVGIG